MPLDETVADSAQLDSPESLQQAFAEFVQLSEQLSESYEVLQQKVATLTEELAESRALHSAELAERERLTDHLQTVLQLLPAGVVVLDQHGVVQEVNASAVELLGEPLQGERWLTVIQRCFVPRQDDGYEVSLRDGRRVSIATRSLECEPGQIVMLTDQTETRELQARLSRHERLSALGKMMASLAHQVRTPLSTAMLYAGHLQADHLPEGQRIKFAGKLMARLQHLEQQIKDMLIFAKGETRLAEPLTTEALLDDCKAAVEPVLDQAGAACQWCNAVPDGSLLGNRDALVGAVQNLVTNAIEASDTNASLEIRLESVQGGYLQLLVKDQGPGVDAETRQRMLEPFYTTKPQGTGLGLAVVKAVAEAHGGLVRIASEPGQGTRVGLVVPFASSR